MTCTRILHETGKAGTVASTWDVSCSDRIGSFAPGIRCDSGPTAGSKIDVRGNASAALSGKVEVFRLSRYGGETATAVLAENIARVAALMARKTSATALAFSISGAKTCSLHDHHPQPVPLCGSARLRTPCHLPAASAELRWSSLSTMAI